MTNKRCQEPSNSVCPGLCFWCEKPFTRGTIGGNAKRFCSTDCKNQFHSASRRWVARAIKRGELSIEDLKRPRR